MQNEFQYRSINITWNTIAEYCSCHSVKTNTVTVSFVDSRKETQQLNGLGRCQIGYALHLVKFNINADYYISGRIFQVQCVCTAKSNAKIQFIIPLIFHALCGKFMPVIRYTRPTL
jgi:hypothetical protein